MPTQYPTSFKGKKYEAKQLSEDFPHCYEVYSLDDGTIRGRIVDSPDGWYILGFVSSPYSSRSAAARVTLGYMRVLAKWHDFSDKCPGCGVDHKATFEEKVKV